MIGLYETQISSEEGNNMDYKQIGMRVRSRREAMGLTREQMAEQLDVSAKFCADIELGNRGMSLETLEKLSQLLSLSCDYILFGRTDSSLENTELMQMLKTCEPGTLSLITTVVGSFLSAINLNTNKKANKKKRK